MSIGAIRQYMEDPANTCLFRREDKFSAVPLVDADDVSVAKFEQGYTPYTFPSFGEFADTVINLFKSTVYSTPLDVINGAGSVAELLKKYKDVNPEELENYTDILAVEVSQKKHHIPRPPTPEAFRIFDRKYAPYIRANFMDPADVRIHIEEGMSEALIEEEVYTHCPPSICLHYFLTQWERKLKEDYYLPDRDIKRMKREIGNFVDFEPEKEKTYEAKLKLNESRTKEWIEERAKACVEARNERSWWMGGLRKMIEADYGVTNTDNWPWKSFLTTRNPEDFELKLRAQAAETAILSFAKMLHQKAPNTPVPSAVIRFYRHPVKGQFAGEKLEDTKQFLRKEFKAALPPPPPPQEKPKTPEEIKAPEPAPVKRHTIHEVFKKVTQTASHAVQAVRAIIPVNGALDDALNP